MGQVLHRTDSRGSFQPRDEKGKFDSPQVVGVSKVHEDTVKEVLPSVKPEERKVLDQRDPAGALPTTATTPTEPRPAETPWSGDVVS